MTDTTLTPMQWAKQQAAKDHPTGSDSWASAEAKERLVNDHTILFLHQVRLEDKAKYGPRWVLVLSENDPSEPRFNLALQSNSYRDGVLFNLARVVAKTRKPVGPLELTMMYTQAGNQSYDLDDWEEFPDELPGITKKPDQPDDMPF